MCCILGQEQLILNNYFPRPPTGFSFANLTKDDVTGSTLHQELLRTFPGRAAFCVPILCYTDTAYNIKVRQTLEMKRLGANRWDEDEPTWRDARGSQLWTVLLSLGHNSQSAAHPIPVYEVSLRSGLYASLTAKGWTSFSLLKP